ncbi:MAG: dicarboxylate/amino acid:cation symporter [Syntrophales bacterium]|nr:dicarboxylate/amino acid:cation symporter [Syntrophales bacterium]
MPEEKKIKVFLKSYRFSVILLVSIIAGAAAGYTLGPDAAGLKPLGDIFLNLLFVTVVPLVFFSISSAIAGMPDVRRLGRIMLCMIVIFVLTGIVASVIMIIAVQLYPPASGVKLALGAGETLQQFRTGDQIVKAFTVPDFSDLMSKKNMLALIVFSMLVGLAASLSRKKAGVFSDFLSSGNEVMLKVVSLVMYYAPVGLFAYFAYLVGVFGPELVGSYMRAMVLYYPVCIAYFFLAFTVYVFLAGGGTAVRRFWVNIIPPSLTAAATGSSLATIPSNLEAANRSGIPREISEIVIPIGATIHMEGSCLAAILKIAFLFGIYQIDFSGTGTILTALAIAVLSGVVMGGIPGGGYVGEMLIISLYGFPLEAFPIISMIGNLVDPPATTVNAIGDNVSSMMIARILGGKNWMENPRLDSTE